ncbi:hypothetical protein CIL05_11295 [Virgibacillus profundi]|uniref:YolD-like family protein n=1 Tax=Virgibacillus profundi TaxID=2024555 RepID=A0A2A2IE78_9BACI|nr:YolD-like family protein [Virgibacillus profundi]PAV29445.1 hypothetical protein CIL05_11295 [Virgibacillus profundi]PXY53614.1 YolD-like family protein [Virgibacillus profundi]
MQQDRGSIKWTSLMLPEHVDLLRNLWQEDKKTSKPILDPQEIEIINDQLIYAYKQQHSVALTVYKDHAVNDYIGTIIKLDKNTNHVSLQLNKYEEVTVNFKNIISISPK